MLGTTPALAASFLAQRGVHPIDFGVGRSRGLRWLESAVAQAMRDMAKGTGRAPQNRSHTRARR